MAKIRKKYITENIDERYYSIVNNIDDSYTHKKINDGTPGNDLIKSGVVSSNKAKKLSSSNSEMGTLPSNVITTGKKLQDFNDPFDETNILVFSDNATSINTNSCVGMPLINLTDFNGVAKGFYITTDESLIATNTISESDTSFFRSRYSLDNSKIFDTPNTFENSYNNKRGIDNSLNNTHPLYEKHVGKITNKIDEHILKQNRFQEKYTPFSEDYSSFFVPEINGEDHSFYYKTVDKEIKEGYTLGEQKQIKITLDFNNSSNLLLLNTKMTFNHDAPTYTKSGFSDDLIVTRYFNFLNGSNVGDAYSSHFMPTAYWNFSNERWNYLDGAILEADDYTQLTLSDFPVSTTGEIKFSYLGAKNTTGKSLTISKNLIFNTAASPVIQSSVIQSDHLNNSILCVHNKPIMTTPSFRNDGSFNVENTGEEFNKTSISRITSSYGFPYKANWQPNNSHLLNMSSYINNDFLLEKVIINGKFTSRGEMPVKKGNFSSGYSESGNSLSSLNDFNSTYNMKDDHHNYIANCLSFFILNERENLNYVNNKVYPDTHQSYFFSKTLDNVTDDTNNTQGKKLKNFLGEFNTYEQFQDTLKVYGQILPNNYFYGIDEYNEVSITKTYEFNSNNNQCNLALYKTVFHYLDEPSGNGLGDIVDSVYSVNSSNSDSLYQNDILSDSNNIKFNIKIEQNENNDFTDFNRESSRELVTYSNLLIVNKYSNISLDDKLLKNIDTVYSIDTVDNSESLHLNIKDKTSFEIKSKAKSINSSNYTDESIYKIKSNYKENVGIQEQESRATIGLSKDLIDEVVEHGFNLFSFSSSSAKDGDSSVTHIFNQTLEQIVGDSLISNVIPFSMLYHSFDLDIDVNNDGNKVPVKYLIKFSYKNANNSGNNNNPYSLRDEYSNETELTIFDFIEMSETVIGNNTYNIIDLNLRFLDPWDGKGILESWLEFHKINEDENNLFYNFGPPASNSTVNVSGSNSSIWVDNPTDTRQYVSIVYFVIFGIFSKTIHTSSGVDTSNKLYQYLTSGKSIVIKKSYPYSATISFKESKVDPYASNSGKSINLNISDIEGTGTYGFFKIIENILSSGFRGVEEASNDEIFHNYNNVLEGKSLGSPSNVGLTSERVIDKELVSIDGRNEHITKSVSGKILLEKSALDNASNISYLLKPEDRLVFGISSNSNGEVMPTVIELHDKLEVTLIGRDYIDTKKQKTNESKSIRKTVVGDNDITRSGTSIYQTKGAYYDNVWNKSELSNSLVDFKNGKIVIGSNASRNFGTYTGINSFDKLFNSDKSIVYKTDSVNPSIANVFFNCLSKAPLFTKNTQDMFNYRKDNSLTPASFKILLSDKISSSRVTSLPNRYSNVVSDWHNTFHLSTYSSFFDHVENPSSISNKRIDDYSYDVFSNYANKTNSKMFIYCDVNSYSAGLDYEDKESQYAKSENNNDKTLSGDREDLCRYYKTLKTYMLPFSNSSIYQNALQITNNNINSLDRFLYKDILIDSDFTKSNIYRIENYSIQYMIHDISPEYCDVTKDVAMDLYGNDISEGISSWCLVIELDDEVGDSLIKEIDIKKEGNFYNDSTVISNNIKYYSKEVWLNFSKYPSSGVIPGDVTSESTITKKFKILTDESGSNDVHFLVAPLYFWETNEINPLSGQSLASEDLTNYGRHNQLYNEANNKSNLSNLNSAWYSSLNNSSYIFDNDNIYDIFLEGDSLHDDATVPPAYSIQRKVNITGNNIAGTTKFMPYTLGDLSSNNGDIYINPDSSNGFLISLSNSKLKNNGLDQNNPTFLHRSINLEKLKNNYILSSDPLYFASEEYLDNNANLIENKKSYNLRKPSNISFNLNEKIYFSNCKNVNLDGSISDTSISFVYNIKNQHIENTSSEEEYSIIELKALHNSYTLLRKNKLLEDTLMYCVDNTTKIRINEDELLENSKVYSENSNFTSPYFEIDLSAKIADSVSTPSNSLIHQIPYANYEFDYEYSELEPSNSSIDASGNTYVNTGSPIYSLSQYPDGYNSKEEQEGKTKDFFYGYSRGGKTRYPVDRLDGFKYGVESGSKKSLNHYFSNSRFGNLSDKIMGSLNCANMYLDKSGVTKFTWPVEKLFVNEHFQYVQSSDVQNIYNTDKYSRSKHPFIEDETNTLSQFYVAP